MKIIDKLNARIDAVNSLVCVGLDSDIEQIPAPFRDDALPQFAFNRHIIDQTHAYAVAYKPNIAFYEARGEQGWHELQLTMDYLHQQHPDIVTICDAKRGDNRTTNMGYVRAIFDELDFDAVTLHPYLGQEALAPFLSRADKACIILCRTSNPGAGEIQDFDVGGKPLWLMIAEKVVNEWNSNQNCMLVTGATYPDEIQRVRQAVGDMPLLVPGVGLQGGDVALTVRAGRDSQGRGMLINASRSIIFDVQPAHAARDLRDTINAHRKD
jgi:orotidine-5'-phosphate decarboxylase